MSITRRQFLKGTAVAIGATGLAIGSRGKILNTLVVSARPDLQRPVQPDKAVSVFTPCSGCHQKCVLTAWVQDGRLVKTEAADFPGDPEIRHCCLKGIASAYLPYYPDRLKYPVKRVGQRGEGKWERISWEEALDTIAEKLKEARDKYGPQSVYIDHTGSSVAPQEGDINSGAEARRFENLFGSTLPNGWFDDTSMPVANFLVHGNDLECSDPRGIKYAKLMIITGANPAESAFRDWKHIQIARDSGTKVIVIGPMFDPTAAKADEFIYIRRATDAALALAMVQVIVENDLHDQEFLRTYTIAPLLVREDNGMLLRESDVIGAGSEERFAIWDEATGEVVFIDRAQFEVPETAALTGRFSAGEVDCKPAFQILVDKVNDEYQPEQVAKITEVPAEKIRQLALEYARSNPAWIYYNFGLGRYFNGNLSTRAHLTLGAVCGYLGKLGGGVSCGGMSIPGAGGGYPISFNYGPIYQPTDSQMNSPTLYEYLETIETSQPYPVKVWINCYRNPIQCCPNPQRWTEKIIPNLDFIVNINIRMDWSAEYADIVLPDTTIFERETLSATMDHVILSGPVIEPLFEARNQNYIWSALGKRLGYGEYFDKSPSDFIRMALETEDPAVEGITYEKLQEAGGILPAKVPKTPYTMLSHHSFSTPTGRIQFYDERLLKWGQELPIYLPSLEAPESKDYPFQFFANRKRYYMHTFMGDMDVLNRYMDEPWADINPKDAAAKGVKDGNLIEVFNDRGRFTVQVLVNPMVPPGTIRTNHGPGPQAFRDGHYQLVTLPHAARETFNPIHELRYQETAPWWKWAGGQADIIFDAAVDFRKVG